MWTLLNGLLPIPFLVIYYAIGTSDGGPLQTWRWIFLLLGVITIVVGVCCFFFLPDTPTDVKWLNDREKAIAIERVARSQTGVKNHVFKWAQVRWNLFVRLLGKLKCFQCKEALTDPVCWLCVLSI